jgi:hypothetical protein
MDIARHVVFMSLHADIAALCDELLEGMDNDEGGVFYPPERPDTPTTGFWARERQLLQELVFQSEGRSAMAKVIADASGRILFQLFTMLDAIGDPVSNESRSWPGMTLRERGDDDHEVLHDEFLEAYHDYIDRRASNDPL